ncbi:MAG: hypothetical protein LBN38_04885 [Verrucomicrobiota bacterium]|jgi:hypothetical protein|nr:hypothetical protein [Verrucomicrobiota bacterium]
MTLSPRDKKGLCLLPAVLLVVLYLFYGALPLRARHRDVSNRLQGLGGSPDGAQARVQAAEAAYTDARLYQEAVYSQIQEARAARGGIPSMREWSSAQRLQALSGRMEEAGLRLVYAARDFSTASAVPSLPLPTGAERWMLHIQGPYVRMLALLDALAADGVSIPETLTMNPSPEPGKPTDWSLAIWL